jgi:hypothetical protein
MGNRTGLDDVEKREFYTLPELEPRLWGGPARSQPIYRLRLPCFSQTVRLTEKLFVYFIFHIFESLRTRKCHFTPVFLSASSKYSLLKFRPSWARSFHSDVQENMKTFRRTWRSTVQLTIDRCYVTPRSTFIQHFYQNDLGRLIVINLCFYSATLNNEWRIFAPAPCLCSQTQRSYRQWWRARVCVTCVRRVSVACTRSSKELIRLDKCSFTSGWAFLLFCVPSRCIKIAFRLLQYQL